MWLSAAAVGLAVMLRVPTQGQGLEAVLRAQAGLVLVCAQVIFLQNGKAYHFGVLRTHVGLHSEHGDTRDLGCVHVCEQLASPSFLWTTGMI